MLSISSFYARWLPMLLCMTILTSCNDNFNLDRIENKPELVVYAFPSTADTTFIQLWRSMPVGTKVHPSAHIGKAHISYCVNGHKRPVALRTDGLHYTLGGQHPGDTVSLSISTDSLPAISAMAMVPQPVPVSIDSLFLVTRIDDEEIKTSYYQVRGTFTDRKGTTDYYAVRVLVRDIGYNFYNKDKPIPKDTAYVWAELNTRDEELLTPSSDLDNRLGLRSDYFRNFYIFEDPSINGRSHTLRLNISTLTETSITYQVDTRAFRIFLYHIDAAYYRYLKSVNDMNNNKLSKYGLAQIRPSASNIEGGTGILGCYTVASSEWKEIDESQQQILY